ncbi:hypothetical protein [Demequina mangrovi]|uniref:Membrane protein YfhO n=1 Tax=Demequina mangrovi TaxID=1043493 RepID=A0A1H7A6P0_9MICO|nr:hypothetical protein [Demequina mangrovi]SEJ59567.1 hypothetical protein SAMN05421637_2356 [Demequina mangrovi]
MILRGDHLLGAIAVGGAVVALMLLLRGPGAFATDDAVNEFLPYLHDIGRIWAGGGIPVLSAESFSGGNYLIDFHRTPYHPLTIGLSLLMYWSGSLTLTSALFAFVVVSATAYGAYGAARILGIGKVLAHGVAIAAATSPVMLDVYTVAWWNGALATATLTFVVWAALAVVRRPSRRNVAGFFVASVLLFYSGWPIALAQYALIGLVVLASLWQARPFGFDVPRNERGARVVALVGSAVAAALVAVPQVSEYLANSEVLARTSTLSNASNKGVVTFLQLAGVAHPTSGDFWLSLGGTYRYWALPVGFVSVLVVLAVASPTRWRDLRGSAAPMLGVTALALALLTQLPERFGPLLYPFRSITAVGFFVALLAATVLSRSAGPWATRRVLAVAAGYTVLAGVYLFRIPSPLGDDRMQAAATAAATLTAVGLLALASRPRLRALAYLGAAVIGPLYVLTVVSPLYGPKTPEVAAAFESAAYATVPRADEGFIAQVGAGENDAWPAYFSSRYLIGGSAVFNGYDPVAQATYRDAMSSAGPKGTVKPAAAAYLAQPGEAGGSCRIDDLGIAALTAVEPLDKATEAALESCGYTRDAIGSTALYTAGAPVAPAGAPTTWDDGLTIDVVERTDRRVVATVENADGAPARLNFSRMWWPGYHAELDGEPVEVVAADGFAVQVVVPAGAAGELTLEYSPRSWGWSIPVGLAGLAAACAVIVLAGRPRELRPRLGTSPAPSAQEPSS